MIIICSVGFAIACVIGYVLETDLSYMGMLILGMLDGVFFIGAYHVLKWIKVSFVDNIHDWINGRNKIISFFENRTFFKVFLILLFAWMPIVFLRYPGMESGGVINQFRQFMGEDTFARTLSPIIYENYYINGHHPVLLTYLFGSFIKFGVMIGNIDLGMYLLSFTVCILNALGWAYVFSSIYLYLKRKIWVTALACFVLNPLIVSLNTYVLKDNLFATLLAVYCVVIFMICQDGMKRKYADQLLIYSVLLAFIKNQGIYIVLISNFILLLCYKREFKIWIRNILVSVIFFCILFQHIFMPLMKIAPGGKQEMFSIFFQATAKTILEHSEEIEKKDFEIIKKILPINDWSVYNPGNSDNIKFKYKQDATLAEISNYFKVWIKWAMKYPKSYMKALLAQTYGYYYIDYETIDWNWKGYELIITDEEKISEPMYEIFNQNYNIFLAHCISHDRYKYLFNIAASFWTIIMCCLIMGKKGKVIWIIPIAIQWMICLLSPINGSGRYGMVIYEIVPVILGVTFSQKETILLEEESNNV